MSTRGTVFIVDDDDSVRASFERILVHAGFDVATFASASELLAEPRRFDPGCLLLDVRMPGMDGLALQEALRRDGCVKPIVFLTGYGTVHDSVKAMKGGAIDFLEKPIEPDRLCEVVEEALERDGAERERLREQTRFRERLSTLTPREREVCEAVIAGRLNKQIARDLGITLRTVKFHRGRVMKKLQVESLAELVRFGRSGGSLRDP
ncbi:MAG: response regulator [Candidatus Palauibacterales bacterium]|nr:response regulator [Candidatus Palauibacterales bacterium]